MFVKGWSFFSGGVCEKCWPLWCCCVAESWRGGAVPGHRPHAVHRAVSTAQVADPAAQILPVGQLLFVLSGMYPSVDIARACKSFQRSLFRRRHLATEIGRRAATVAAAEAALGWRGAAEAVRPASNALFSQLYHWSLCGNTQYTAGEVTSPSHCVCDVTTSKPPALYF